MGPDWVLKFALSTSTDESLECLQANVEDMAGDASRIVSANTMVNFVSDS